MSAWIKAEEIDNLLPGSVIRADGRDWIRMGDWPERHIKGYLFHGESGEWNCWQALFLWDTEVELIKRQERT